jgi:GntR family transcriptional regulator of arabinose operon
VKKYQRVETWIRSSITENKFGSGDKLPSESQLCEQFGVSRNAVRQAIRNLVQEGWVKSTKGVGTFCRSRIPTTNLTTNIGFVEFFVGSYIFPEIIRGCDHVLYKKGFHLLLNQSEYDLEKERNILLGLRNKKVDGIIIAPVYDGNGQSNADLLEEFQKEGIAIVLCDNYFADKEFSFVALDDRTGGTEAAAYLWSKGHRKIGIFYQKDYLVKIHRMQGAAEYLRSQGAPVRDEWIVGFKGQGRASEAAAVAERFFSQNAELPTAFLCSNDEDALHLIRVAEKRKIRVPDDLSVVGFDDSSIAQLEQVSLTSVHHPSFSMGEIMTNILMDKIFHPELRLVTRTIITPSIVERTSVRTL